MKKATVLIVDDETDLLEMNKEVFEIEGFDVTTAKNGFEAIECISDLKFDAILTDYRMPRMNGIQLANYVKVSEQNSRTPIFVISGDISDGSISKLRDVGVLGFISKPYDISKVAQVVKAKIARPSKIENYSPEIKVLFEQAAVETFAYYFEDAHISEFKLATNKAPLGHYSSVVPIYGTYVFGYIAVYCNSDLLAKICQQLFGASSSDFGDSFMIDLVGEISNNIVGNLKLKLGDIEEVIQIGLPISMQGYPQAMSILPASPRGVMTIKLQGMLAFVEFGLGDPLKIACLGNSDRINILEFKKAE